MPLLFGAVRVSISMIGVLTVLVIGCPAILTPTAAALEPGVHIDPGSPAAKEYALPLNQARQTGVAPRGGSSGPAPFGAGIRPPGGSGGGPSNSGSAGSGVSPKSGVSPANASRTKATIPAVVLRSASEPTSSGGDGSILALIGGGVAILVLGGFGGMVMRRSHRTTPLA
jgi:hypothetical protein